MQESDGPSFGQLAVWLAWGIALLNGLTGYVSKLLHKEKNVAPAVAIWTCIVTIVCAIAIWRADSTIKGWAVLGILLAVATAAIILRDTIATYYFAIRTYIRISAQLRRIEVSKASRTAALESVQLLLANCKTQEDLERLTQSAAEARSAGPSHVKDALVRIRFLDGLSADAQEAKRAALAEALLAENLFEYHRGGFPLGGLRRFFRLRFDVARFLVGPLSDDLVAFRLDMRREIAQRFKHAAINTVVYISHEGVSEAPGRFFEDLKKEVGAQNTFGFLPNAARKPSATIDTTLLSRAGEACGGKNILLIEPIWLDYSLDDAYLDIIDRVGGQLAGVVVMFEVAGAPKLRSQEELEKHAGVDGLCGQTVLNLLAV